MAAKNLLKESFKSLYVTPSYEGQRLSTATGFVVVGPRGPLLITNRHVVTGRHHVTGELLSPMGAIPNELAILHNSVELGTWHRCVEPLFNSAGQPLWMEHPDFGTRADVVALPLTMSENVRLHPYDLFETEPNILFGPADAVSVVGFPFGIQVSGSVAVWATGFVASEPDLDYEGLPIFLIDCRSRHGQSGSPVVFFRSSGFVTMGDGTTAMFPSPLTRLWASILAGSTPILISV